MPTPVRLSDQQMTAVFAASHPLPPHRRSAFLVDVARELARLGDIGDGVLHRTIMLVQRRHFDPPLENRGRPRLYDDDDERRHRRRSG